MYSRLLPLTMSLLAAAVSAAEPVGEVWQGAAEKLQQATVTVRIWEQPAGEDQKPAVTVCSGLCVRAGSIVTAALAGSDSPIRLTLPGGKQADAEIAVIDEYSGLALLGAETTPLAPLVLAGEAPAVGGEVLAAAAWGLEAPLISRGIVGGVDRQHPRIGFPPLMQCDVLTESTSTGAGIVDRSGQLLGVIVAADREPGRRGWAYAVPASHVGRLLRVADEQKAERKEGGVVILKRRRPIVGMVLDQAGAAVLVQRVEPGGPAERAGIKPGDEVLATDGVAIRSVYQGVLPTLYKQPGDTTTFRIRREGAIKDAQVVLGGGVPVTSAPADFLAGIVQPKVRLARDVDGAIVTRRGETDASKVAAQVTAFPPLPGDAPPVVAPTAAEKIALLEKALERYQSVIELQQKLLADEQKKREEQELLLRSLREEIEAVRQTVARPSRP
jgi:S1-C subfamily serine protease